MNSEYKNFNEILEDIERSPITSSKFLRLFLILKSLTEEQLLDAYLLQIKRIFTKGFKSLETDIDIQKKIALYSSMLYAMQETELLNIFSAQVNEWFSFLFQEAKNTMFFLELAQAIRYNPHLGSVYFNEFLTLIRDLPPLRRAQLDRLRSLKRFLFMIKPEQILTDSPLLKEIIDSILNAIEQEFKFISNDLRKILLILKRASIVDGYSSRIKTLISRILAEIEADERGCDLWLHDLYFLMDGVKSTFLMEFFFPRFEVLFLKMLDELERMDHKELEHYLKSEEFPPFIEVTEGTKLDKKFIEWERKKEGWEDNDIVAKKARRLVQQELEVYIKKLKQELDQYDEKEDYALIERKQNLLEKAKETLKELLKRE